MGITTVGWAVLIGSCFAWPIIARFSGVGGAWTGTIVFAVTFGTLAIWSLVSGQFGHQAISRNAILILVFAGLLNGIGCYLYSEKVTDPSIPAGVFVALVSISSVLAASLLSIPILGVGLTLKQWAGVAAGVVAIALLK